ncbi:MAG: AAA family ATPase [Myxococcales bacterium]|nr:AAA family ATPase [Myxococcales bacterium]MCB9644832.1 AAA family ATPase [Myxococcales bacterium]
MEMGYASGTSFSWGQSEASGQISPDELQSMLELTRRVFGGVGAHLRQAIMGRDDVIELVLVALLADGHVLLEDYPGSGKTTLAKALGRAIKSQGTDFHTFRRVQFTPDLLPSDITGVSIFQPQKGTFSFNPGPVFTHILLADEINRTPPKVQAAMLEAMGEKQVTADGQLYPLDELFFVIATQNPLDVTGTYPLPTPQLDRFLFKIPMNYIDRDAEMEVLALQLKNARMARPSLDPVSREEILACRKSITRCVQVSLQIRETLVDIAQEIRRDRRVLQGISTRSLVLALPALQARAAIHGRDYVSAEDVQRLGPYLFCHRMERAPGSPDAEILFRDASRAPLERLVQGIRGGRTPIAPPSSPPPMR